MREEGCTYAGDGDCDSFNNNAECDYDAGDCCECECSDGEFYDCGAGGYDCVDPFSACYAPVTPSPTPSADCIFEGDGWCDTSNNDPACNYDGGDCCECDCVDSNYTCGVVDYACIDPASTCQYHNYGDDGGGSTSGTDDDGGLTIVSDDSGGLTNVTDDDGGLTNVTDDDGGLTNVTDDDDESVTAVPDDDGDDGNRAGGPVPISDDDDGDGTGATTDSDNGGAEATADNETPVGIIVAGAGGGAVFLGALVVLACCLKTGRLKGCKCCSSSTPAAAAVPPSAEGPSMVEAERGAASSSVAADPAAARLPPLPPAHPPSPPPAYEESPSHAATDVSAYPGTTAPLPPPPAYEGPSSLENPRP